MSIATITQLKRDVRNILKRQGYLVRTNGFILRNQELETKRQVHNVAKIERISQHVDFIKKKSKVIEKFLIDGAKIDIDKIQPRIIEVEPNSEMEIIFRWWNLVWWSLPHEKAYGRQMRFVIWDDYHNAPIGLVGLQSPILSWEVRDKYLGINIKERDFWVNQSLSAQRLGALPPYNYILGGKLIALLLTSDIIRKKFELKYKNKKTLIKNRILPANLLFITTTGAYGKSSVYTRLKKDNEWIARFIGYSKGSGTFHIPNIMYQKFLKFLERKHYNIKTGYGNGPSRKLRLINQALEFLGFHEGTTHGVKRAVYLFPLVKNLKEVIEKNKRPIWVRRDTEELTNYWKEKWAKPRSQKNKTYLTFKADSFLKDTLKLVTNYQRRNKKK